MKKRKVGIIGNGRVGSALKRGLDRAGYETRSTGNDPKAVRETGAFGEVVILAVPFIAVDDTLSELGDTLQGKTVIDATNALTPDYQLAIGFSTSGAEELQKKAKDARVVKAFNTVFADQMDKGKVNGTSLSIFVASNDEQAKRDALEMARDIGFDAIDAGPLQNARWVETLGYLNIQLGHGQNLGPNSGFKYIHPEKKAA